MRGDEETPLVRDRDGSILLIRLPGDAWTTCKCQADADWIRANECSGALTGLTRDGVSFLRVVPLSEVKDALLGEKAKQAAREDAESASVYTDLDPEYVAPMVDAALEAALRFLPSDSEEGQR